MLRVEVKPRRGRFPSLQVKFRARALSVVAWSWTIASVRNSYNDDKSRYECTVSKGNTRRMRNPFRLANAGLDARAVDTG